VTPLGVQKNPTCTQKLLDVETWCEVRASSTSASCHIQVWRLRNDSPNSCTVYKSVLKLWDGTARYPPNFVDHVYVLRLAPSKVQGSRNDYANGSAGSQTAPRRLVFGQRIALVPSLSRRPEDAECPGGPDHVQLTLGDRQPVTWSDRGIAARN